ncbi:MAG TPA: alpha/beta fold hydrolase [Ignavibacteria bacterium]
MDKPNIAQKSPIIEKVKKGTYYWCACGQSKSQPYCDGSHKGSNFVPIEVIIPEEKNVAWCACKQSGNRPFCDGTHKSLQMKSLFINGLKVCDYGGSYPPLIFIHAFPLSSKMWKHQVDFFKSQYRVITYDVRGLGESKTEDNQYMMENFVDDFFSIIDNLNIEKSYVCGLSMGGYIILRAASKAPERFKGIILADTKAEKDDDEGLLNRSNSISQIKRNGVKEFTGVFLKKLVTEKNYGKPLIKEFLDKILIEQTPAGICGALIAIATRTDTSQVIKKLDLPTLIIVGEKDILIPLNFSVNLNNSIKESNLVIIPDSGHLTNIENPKLFNKVVSDFLELNK